MGEGMWCVPARAHPKLGGWRFADVMASRILIITKAAVGDV
jgi:hypothetical protein